MSLIRALSLAALSYAAVLQAQNVAPRLELTLDRERYLQGQESNFYLMATVHTGDATGGEVKQDANLVFLIDRSGSMAGAHFNALKFALREALQQLSSRDRIAILAFGSTVETLLPSTPIDQLDKANVNAVIENILDEGGAALHEGLLAAAAEARAHSDPAAINRILLFTDGPPNKGPRDLDTFAKIAEDLAEEQIGIVSFGIGRESPQDLLEALSSPSGHSVNTAQDSASLSQLLKKEFDHYNPIVATEATLEIDFASGTEITESIGREADLSYRSTVFQLGSLHANREIIAIVQGRIGASKSNFTKGKIAEARLILKTPDLESPEQRLQSSIETRFTTSEEFSFETIRTDVYQRVCEAEVSDAIRESLDLYQEGKDKKALRDLKRLARNIRSVAKDIPELQVEASLDQLTLAIDSIEKSEAPSIDQRALSNTLFKSARPSESRKSAE